MAPQMADVGQGSVGEVVREDLPLDLGPKIVHGVKAFNAGIAGADRRAVIRDVPVGVRDDQ